MSLPSTRKRKLEFMSKGDEIQTTTTTADLSRFTMGKKISNSLQGCVRRATDTLSQKTVAIKVSSTRLVNQCISRDGRPIVEDVRKEAELLNWLGRQQGEGSNHFTKLVAKGEDESTIFVALEFAGKGELFDMMGHKDLDLKSAFRQLCLGVKFLHSLNVAHRDMSLENVLMNDDDKNTIKICDFGVAGKFKKDQVLRNRTFVGKAAYGSPQLHYLQDYNPFAADIWALGIMLVRLAFARDLWRETKLGLASLASSGKSIRYLVERAAEDCDDMLLVDLICSLLSWEEKDRPTIQDVLDHAWLDCL